MRVIRTVAEMSALGGGDLGLVPTMGAFHDGHLELMKEALRHHPSVCVSLFVNPLQFGQNEDLASYPRDEARDLSLAESLGVHIIFAPTSTDMYPRIGTTVHVPELTELWEGARRPGHFDGVATVVSKLFNVIRPRTAYFGWKDLQQCLVIQRMVADLNVLVDLKFLETVREPDGVAMSSRNAYLNMSERELAPHIYGILRTLRNSLQHAMPRAQIDETIQRAQEDLRGAGISPDYLELVDMNSLRPLRRAGSAALIVAARIGTTRLIDNVRFDFPEPLP